MPVTFSHWPGSPAPAPDAVFRNARFVLDTTGLPDSVRGFSSAQSPKPLRCPLLALYVSLLSNPTVAIFVPCEALISYPVPLACPDDMNRLLVIEPPPAAVLIIRIASALAL